MSGIGIPADVRSSSRSGGVVQVVLVAALVAVAIWLDAVLIRNLRHGWADLPNGGTPGAERVLLALGAVPLVLAGIGIGVGCWRRWPVRRTVVVTAVVLGASAAGAILLHEALYARLSST